MIAEKRKKPNAWLVDPDFISKTNYRDRYYIEQLFRQVSKFLDYCPVVVFCFWNRSTESIVFSVGSESKAFKVNMDYSFYDYTTLVSRWLRNFFPQYKTVITETRKLNPDEVSEIVAETGITLEEAMERTKQDTHEESGLIDRVFLLEDTIRLTTNGEMYIRQCNVPAAEFLRGYRAIRTEPDSTRREYILNNSRVISKIDTRKEVVVDYDFNKMINFFKIQIEDHWDKDVALVIENDEEWYKWGRFKFQLLTNEIKKSFFHVYDSYRLRMEKKERKT